MSFATSVAMNMNTDQSPVKPLQQPLGPPLGNPSHRRDKPVPYGGNLSRSLGVVLLWSGSVPRVCRWAARHGSRARRRGSPAHVSKVLPRPIQSPNAQRRPPMHHRVAVPTPDPFVHQRPPQRAAIAPLPKLAWGALRISPGRALEPVGHGGKRGCGARKHTDGNFCRKTRRLF
jgi:hypothetical protein